MFVFSVCRLVSRRCHNISSLPDGCSAPSQNRTCAVNAYCTQLSPVYTIVPSDALLSDTRRSNPSASRAGQCHSVQPSIETFPSPGRLARLAAATQRAEQLPLHCCAELHQPGPIVIDPIVLIVTLQLPLHGLPHDGQRCCQMTAKPIRHRLHLGSEFLLRRAPHQFEFACAAKTAVVASPCLPSLLPFCVRFNRALR